MSYQHLSIEHRGPIAIVTFNRPERANALHYAHLAEIEQAALAFRDDAEIRAIVFTGAGKHFSSGADLTDPGNEYRVPMVLRRRRTRIGERVIRALLDIDQITIAAWNGAAMGGGACIATALDFRIGADDCFMQYPEIDIGLNLMWQSLPLCTRLVGAARTKRLVAGGERIHAPTLLQWGAIDELVPRSELLDRAVAMAQHYAAKPPIAVQMIKRSVNAIEAALDRSLMHMDADQNLLTQSTDDRRVAASTYRTSEKPVFKGD
ncbi:MAG TPA: enoyl-CoA hydratase/isomerase family protein [Pseudomonadales bacterium]|jgi:enoyl-CoA hydratase/carnithine racemase|nr:enoyl-CoA hydratase/isomerase family protein [Pseudomonadales bacterium]